MLAERAGAQHVEHVPDLAAVVVDGGRREPELELGGAGDDGGGLVLGAAAVAQLLHLVEHHALDLRAEHVGPALELVVVEQQHVGERAVDAHVVGLGLAHHVGAQRGREQLDLVLPLSRQVGERDHERGQRARVGQRADRRHRLAEADVVGEQQALAAQQHLRREALVAARRVREREGGRLVFAGEQVLDRLGARLVLRGAALEVFAVVDLHRVAVEEPEEIARVLLGVAEAHRRHGHRRRLPEHALEPQDHVRLRLDHEGVVVAPQPPEQPAHSPPSSRWHTTTGLPTSAAGSRRCVARVVTSSTLASSGRSAYRNS